MRWEDESYVKLYVRDTLTWRSWNWQARTVLMHLLRKVDQAGMMSCEGFDPTDAVALMVDLPVEVVQAGLAPLIKSGTIQVGPGMVIVTNYVEAQEARKTDKLRKKDQRQRDRDKARAGGFVGSDVGADIMAAAERHTESHDVTPTVTRSHTASREVTRGHPPTSASTSSPSSTSSPLNTPPACARENAPAVSLPQEPILRDRMDLEFKRQRGGKYDWNTADEVAMGEILAKAGLDEGEVLRRWGIGLRRKKWPECHAVTHLAKHWNAYAAEEAVPGADPPRRGAVAPAKHPVGEIPNPFRKRAGND